ncbi:MAG: hypothetical protein ACXAD7_14265 [Candidatus Kariarchaeaceae archaeon]
MKSQISADFHLAIEQYLEKIKPYLSANKKEVLRTQIIRGSIWALIFLWPILLPMVLVQIPLSMILFLLLFGLFFPIKAIINVFTGFTKLSQFLEELLYEGEIYDAVIQHRIEEFQTDLHVAFTAKVNNKNVGIWASKSCQENDVIKVLYHLKFPDKVLPIDHIEKRELNPIFYFDEEAAGLILPADDYFSGVTP